MANAHIVNLCGNAGHFLIIKTAYYLITMTLPLVSKPLPVVKR